MTDVIIVGAGVVGITTAWYLADAGYEVHVFERHGHPACETSHANGGHISSQSAAPWLSPEAIKAVFRPEDSSRSGIKIGLGREPARWRWLLLALQNCMPKAYALNLKWARELGAYSRVCLDRLNQALGLAYAREDGGSFALYRNRKAYENALRHAAGYGQPLPLDALLEKEPGLIPSRRLISGTIWYPGDATGDCSRFTKSLANAAATRGVKFHYAEPITGLRIRKQRLQAVQTEQGVYKTRFCIVAAGVDTAPMLRTVNLRIPIYPLKGYSCTVPIEPGTQAPGRFVDVARRVVFARHDNRLRAAGIAEMVGYDARVVHERISHLLTTVRDWYQPVPDSASEPWACLRPMSPDGVPMIGSTAIEGLWLNSGHGPLGWTFACGSARMCSDMIQGLPPEICAEPYRVGRYRT